ncbi:MAG: hypothetical protein M1836_001754 [Candelina mexicana]|nr:MAG: hypothetical protein M1836_001754 [Candelina mexicana]
MADRQQSPLAEFVGDSLWYSQLINFDTTDHHKPESLDIKSPTTQDVQETQPSGVTSLVDQSLSPVTMANPQQTPMQQIPPPSLPRPPLQFPALPMTEASRLPDAPNPVAPVADMGAWIGARDPVLQLGNTTSSSIPSSATYTGDAIVNRPEETRTWDHNNSILNSSYAPPELVMQPVSTPYFGMNGGKSRSSNSPLEFDYEEAQNWLNGTSLGFGSGQPSSPYNFLNQGNPFTHTQGWDATFGNIDPAITGEAEVAQYPQNLYPTTDTNGAWLLSPQADPLSLNDHFDGQQNRLSKSPTLPPAQVPPNSLIQIHCWGDDPVSFTDSEAESTGGKRMKKLRETHKGSCGAPKKVCASKKVKKGNRGKDAENETDSENDLTAKDKKAKLRPRVDPKHPHVRQNNKIGYKNSRGEGLEEFRAEDHYEPLQRPPAPWDCFTYTPEGELESDRRYTVHEIWRYLNHHPLHHSGQNCDATDSRLQLRIQRVPADSERRYPGAVSSICRFADCQRKPDNDMRIGHYRVAFDEQSHKGRTSDPFVHTGLVRDLNFRIENRHLPCEVKGDNKMAMDNEKVYTVAYDFVKACKKGNFSLQYPTYPARPNESRNFGDDHEGTLTKALTKAKVAAEPESKRKKRLAREATQASQGMISCNVEKHLGNLALITNFDKRKVQLRAEKHAAEGRTPRNRGSKRKQNRPDSGDEADAPNVPDDEAPWLSRPTKESRPYRPDNEPYLGDLEDDIIGSVEEPQEAENEPQQVVSAKGKEVIYDSITLDIAHPAPSPGSGLRTGSKRLREENEDSISSSRSNKRSRADFVVISSTESSPHVKAEQRVSPITALFLDDEAEAQTTPIAALAEDGPETRSRKRLRDADEAELGPRQSPLLRASKRLRPVKSS